MILTGAVVGHPGTLTGEFTGAFQKGCSNVVQMLFKCCSVLLKCCSNVVQIMFKCCLNIVHMLVQYFFNVVSMPHRKVFKIYYEIFRIGILEFFQPKICLNFFSRKKAAV